MTKRLIPGFIAILFLAFFGAISVSAQSPYTSVASGPWNADATWSGTGVPVAGNTVTIANTHNVTVSAAAAFCGTLNINNGGTLTLQGFAITVTGTTTVNGTVTTAVSAAGTKSFGVININATGQWNLSGQNPATSFSGNITNGGTFNNGSGAVTIGASLSLLGANAMTFGGIVTVGGGFTLTNSNTNVAGGGINLTNTGIALAGGGTFTQGATTNTLTYSGSSIGITTFNTGGANNTVNYSGGTQAIRDGAYVNLSTSGTLTKTWTLLAGRVVSGILTVGAGTTLVTVSNNTLGITGATNVNGTLNLGGTGLKTFTGAVDINAGGTWDLSGAVQPTSFAGGISNDGATLNNGTGAVTIAATQSLLGASAMAFGGIVTIGGGFTLTNSNTNVAGGGVNLTNTGIALAGTGTFTQGTTTNTLTYLGSSIGITTFNATGTGNTVNYTGGAQTLEPVAYYTLGVSGSGAKTMTGVTTIGGHFSISGATTTATATAALTIAGNFTLTSGTFVAGAFSHNIAGNWVRNGGTFTNTGSTINFNGITQNIGGTATTNFNNLTIASALTSTFSFLTTVAGTLEINNGSQVNLGGLLTHTANRLTFGGRGESSGTWGGNAGAANISATYFVGASGIITVAVTGSASIHFQEDFTSEADGATSSTTPPWSVTQDPGGTFSKQSIIFGLIEIFQINGTGTEGVWETADLDIPAASNFTEVYINLDVTAWATMGGSDYVDVSYVWDAEGPGSAVSIANTSTTVSPSVFLSTAGHSKIRLVIRADENTGGGFNFFTLTNISILGIRNLYSRANANWDTNGTWSSVAINGVDCVCAPSTLGTDRVFIGGGRTVTLDANGTAAAVTVNGTADAGGAGILQWVGDFSLSMPLEGGAVTVNNGGQMNMNPGTLTNAQLTFTQDAASTIVNNGTISISDIIVAGPQFDAASVSLSGSGTTTLSDDLTVTGATSGFADVNASFTNSSTGVFTIGGTTTLNEATFTSTAVTPSANLVFRGGITSNASSIFNAGGATFNTNIQTLGGAGTLNFANLVVVNTPTVITNNAIVTMTSTAAGTLSGTGTWNQGTGTLNYAGSTMTVAFDAAGAGNTVNYSSSVAQAIRTPSTSYTNLTLNNSFVTSPQFTVANPLTVTGVLTMTDGNVNLNGNAFTLSSNANGALVHSLAAASGWMYGGSFTRGRPASTGVTVGTARSLFPLGSDTDWRPFFVGQGTHANTAGTMTVTHTNSTTTSTVSIPDSGPVTIVRRHDAFWTIVTGGSSAGATYNLSAGGTNFGTIEAGASDLRMTRASSVVGAHLAGSGGPTDWRVNRNSLSHGELSNDFFLASTDAVNSPLPIELVSFKGEVVENTVQLNWETASELNNDFFTVERSAGGEVFSSIGQVNGAGTTNQGKRYSLIDSNPIYGTAYYRLKQTDFDGTFTYSKIIDVTYEGSGVPVMDVFPNPSVGNQFTVRITGIKNMEFVPVVMYDQLGRECMKLLLNVDQNSGTAIRSFSPEAKLPRGMYILKAGHSPSLTVRISVTDK